MRELANLYLGVNYKGGSESVSRSRSKGRGNRIVLRSATFYPGT
jgi:hypothetical protein